MFKMFEILNIKTILVTSIMFLLLSLANLVHANFDRRDPKRPLGALDKILMEDKEKKQQDKVTPPQQNRFSQNIGKELPQSPGLQENKFRFNSEQKKTNKANMPTPPKPPELTGKKKSLPTGPTPGISFGDDKPINATLQAPPAEKVRKKVDVSELLKINYDIYKLPRPYYAKPFSKANSHLPPAYFKSYYAELAFNAVTKNDLNAIRFFINKYKLQTKSDSKGNTMLMHSANLSRHNVARLLLAKGADVNAQNHYGMTALHVACLKGDVEMAKILLTMGADFAAVDKYGLSPLDYAKKRNNNEIISMIKEYYLSVLSQKTVRHSNKVTTSKKAIHNIKNASHKKVKHTNKDMTPKKVRHNTKNISPKKVKIEHAKSTK